MNMISKSTMSEAEWNARVDLAALYRLVALNGWDDLIFTHISARVPGTENDFLVNPLGQMFEEITASNLVKVDRDGNITSLAEGDEINPAGFAIHSAVHGARRDAHFVIHLHTLDGMAVAAQSEGLLPLNQISLFVLSQLAYHDYKGVADLDECESLVEDLGDRDLMMLRNHGTMALGEFAGDAWLGIYALERACAIQVRALGAGRSGVDLAPVDAQQKVAAQTNRSESRARSVQLLWAAQLRRLRRLSLGFDR